MGLHSGTERGERGRPFREERNDRNRVRQELREAVMGTHPDLEEGQTITGCGVTTEDPTSSQGL